MRASLLPTTATSMSAGSRRARSIAHRAPQGYTGAREEVVLDVGALAASHPHQYQLGWWIVSPNNARIAFAVDFNGDREFRIFARTSRPARSSMKGSIMRRPILSSPPTAKRLFYVRNEPTTLPLISGLAA